MLFTGEEWATLERDARAIAQELKRVDRPDEMEAGVGSLERRHRKAREHLEMLLKDVIGTPWERKCAPPIYLQTKPLSSRGYGNRIQDM